MIEDIIVSGKVLLSGEYSVVYGYPALVARIDKQLRVKLEPAPKFLLESDRQDDQGLVRYGLELSDLDPELVKVTVTSDLRAGMGSSAALCAGIIKAAYRLHGKTLSTDKWFELTWECERKAHGNSSGADPAAVIYGGLLWYVRDKELNVLTIPKSYRMLLVQTGKPAETTGEMVARVEQCFKKDKIRTAEILGKIGVVTAKLREKLEQGEEIKGLVNDNGCLLEDLGVVGEKASKVSRNFRRHGCGVKITGAGGLKDGSGMLLVTHPEIDTIATEVSKAGTESFMITIGRK